ncbi:MFS transporter, partial [Lactobacillus sp. XV13L]|nr:MFS transporter [Lactobacillus sp. XV13L]
TGIYFTFGSLASFSIPIITGWLSQTSIAQAMRFDIFVGLAGLILVSLACWALRTPKSLSNQRQQINKIDQRIIRLLNRRFKIVTTISDLKLNQQLPILDKQRESNVLKTVAQKTAQSEHIPYLQAIYQTIMT